MPKQIISQKPTDNKYFHQDFHIALNYAIEYLNKKYGLSAVKEYLTQFTNNYHIHLKKALSEKGLLAIKDHYTKIFEIEGANFNMNLSKDDLLIRLLASPAVSHIRSNGHQVSTRYHETIATVNKEICRNSPYDCDLLEYDDLNGAYKLHFYKKVL